MSMSTVEVKAEEGRARRVRGVTPMSHTTLRASSANGVGLHLVYRFAYSERVESTVAALALVWETKTRARSCGCASVKATTNEYFLAR